MKQSNSETRIEVTRADLPVHCPMPDTSLWNSHPRVYIPLGDAPDGRATCEYCGTEFVLVEALVGASLDDERPPMTDANPAGTG